MIYVDKSKYKTTTTHIEKFSNGSVLVITDVPAYAVEEDGIEQITYDMDVALAIDDFTAKCFEKGLVKNQVLSYCYDDLNERFVTDFEVRFSGKNINLTHATTKVWNEVSEKLHNGYSYIRKAFADIFRVKDIGYPLARLRAGSIIFELQSKQSEQVVQDSVFPDVIIPEIQIMQLLVDGYEYTIGNGETENPLIIGHPQIRLATVKAIERLSPHGASDIEAVELIPNKKLVNRDKVVTLTRDTHYKAQQKLKLLKTPEEELMREVEITGKVATLNTDGTFAIKSIKRNFPDGHRHPTRAIFHEAIRATLAEFWKTQEYVVFKGIEYKSNGDWSSVPVIKVAEKEPLGNDN